MSGDRVAANSILCTQSGPLLTQLFNITATPQRPIPAAASVAGAAWWQCAAARVACQQCLRDRRCLATSKLRSVIHTAKNKFSTWDISVLNYWSDCMPTVWQSTYFIRPPSRTQVDVVPCLVSALFCMLDCIATILQYYFIVHFAICKRVLYNYYLVLPAATLC